MKQTEETIQSEHNLVYQLNSKCIDYSVRKELEQYGAIVFQAGTEVADRKFIHQLLSANSIRVNIMEEGWMEGWID